MKRKGIKIKKEKKKKGWMMRNRIEYMHHMKDEKMKDRRMRRKWR
jgi:hypothetical protein